MASRDIESQSPRTPILRRAGAGLVLLAVVAVVLYFAIHLIMTIVVVVAVLVAVAAVLWALNTLL